MEKGDTFTTKSGRVQHIVYTLGKRLDWDSMSKTQERKALNRHWDTPLIGMPTIDTAQAFCGEMIDLPFLGKIRGPLCHACVGVIAEQNLSEIMRLARTIR